MSLSIGLARIGLALPRLPEIKIGIPNPFASPSSSSSSAQPSLRQKLQEYLENKKEQLEDAFSIDNGILRAAPKQKVSPQKRKQKLYGPGSKQLKHLHNLNRCPSCGHYKRAHTLCMHCVSQIQRVWRKDLHATEKPKVVEQELDELDKRILYPGKVESEYSKMLKKRREYVDRRTRTLPVEKKN